MTTADLLIAAATSATSAAARRAHIVRRLLVGPASIATLARNLSVSKATIERDLDDMIGLIPLRCETDARHKQRQLWRLERTP